MTIIDTTTYCNGELRLAKHGAGKGGNVLLHVPSGRQIELTDAGAANAPRVVHNMLDHPPKNQWASADIFDNIARYWRIKETA